MGKITFILGGARSGKSSYAIELAKKFNKKVAFIATCLPLDEEMKGRIALHRKKRPLYWQTFEEPKDLVPLLKRCTGFNLVIIDCLTLFISNLLSERLSDTVIQDRIEEILKELEKRKSNSIIVSNEVGLGIVPDNELARRFRDLAGRINQMVLKRATDAFFMIAGSPLKLKKGK